LTSVAPKLLVWRALPVTLAPYPDLAASEVTGPTGAIIADPALLRVTVADKIDNARAILADHRRIGDDVWARFNAPREDILWYYTEALKAYRQAAVNSPLLDDLQILVWEMRKVIKDG